MSKFQLAQINIARLKAPLDSHELKDFVDNLDRINALAESSDGFVWRLVGDGVGVGSGRVRASTMLLSADAALSSRTNS